jgi:hypothetical protein
MKRKKKTLQGRNSQKLAALFFCMLGLILFLTNSAKAKTYYNYWSNDTDYTYTINDDGNSVTITSCSVYAENVSVPFEIDNKKVTCIEGSFSSCCNLISVTIPDSVITIGYHTFLL